MSGHPDLSALEELWTKALKVYARLLGELGLFIGQHCKPLELETLWHIVDWTILLSRDPDPDRLIDGVSTDVFRPPLYAQALVAIDRLYKGPVVPKEDRKGALHARCAKLDREKLIMRLFERTISSGGREVYFAATDKGVRRAALVAEQHFGFLEVFAGPLRRDGLELPLIELLFRLRASAPDETRMTAPEKVWARIQENRGIVPEGAASVLMAPETIVRDLQSRIWAGRKPAGDAEILIWSLLVLRTIPRPALVRLSPHDMPLLGDALPLLKEGLRLAENRLRALKGLNGKPLLEPKKRP